MKTDTIFALATGSARAGVAIVRVSGRRAAEVLRRLAGIRTPEPRRATLATFKILNGEILDQGMFIWFPGPASFTGEDVVEFHVHGSRAVIGALADAILAIDDCRQAEPGEFTRRAFDNGKLGLTEVEGLADLVAAETEAQRRQAMAQMQGRLGQIYDAWRDRLLNAQARLEAEIDFSDQDLPAGLRAGIRVEVENLQKEIEVHLNDRNRGERVRGGIQIAIVGAPNVGKSTLLNCLAQREVAIVSDMPGTTRDVLEAYLDLGGFPVILSDTAGLRVSADEIEAEGLRRARNRAVEADYVLAVFDATQALDSETQALMRAGCIPVFNKADVAGAAALTVIGGIPAEAISARTGAGIDKLVARLEAVIKADFTDTGSPTLTRSRHRVALIECREALSRFVKAEASELAAEELRIAAQALGRITGRVGVEDMLDVVFRDFCIGK